MKSSYLSAAAIGLGMLVTASGCSSSEKTEGDGKNPGEQQEPNIGPKPAGDGGHSLQNFVLASMLHKWGRDNSDPAAIALAAEIWATSGETQMKNPDVSNTGPGEAGGSTKDTSYGGPDGAREEAMKLAGSDEAMKAMIGAIRKLRFIPRGATGGTRYDVHVVPNGWTTTYKITFNANEYADISVTGDGASDLDVYVFDQNGNLIASDRNSTDHCFCSWAPKWTGEFRIEIRNVGTRYNKFIFRTN